MRNCIRMGEKAARVTLTVVLVAGFTACDDVAEPTSLAEAGPTLSQAAGVVPGGVIPVALGAESVELWPFTGTDVAGATSDPINLLFPGVDLRDVRTALLALDGNRTAFGMPPVAPFDCTWSDAIGANQTTYTSELGWQGSAIQLECGDYQPMRFHVRLFDAGAGTVGNAHFEVIIPGTNQHEVLSWELAEQILTVDMIRSGLLSAPVGSSATLNPAPSFKTINPLVYNGLPVALRGLIGGPLGNVSAPVPIPSNGRATVFALGDVGPATPMDATENTVLQFGQVIPKPFCATGPGDYVFVQGPVDFHQRVTVRENGDYRADFHAEGSLAVTPINPLTGQPLGPTYRADVSADYGNWATDQFTRATNKDLQTLLREGLPSQVLDSRLRAGSTGTDRATVSVACG